MRRIGLTDTQHLYYIVAKIWISKYNVVPTITEMSILLNISKSSSSDMMSKLRSKGIDFNKYVLTKEALRKSEGRM